MKKCFALPSSLCLWCRRRSRPPGNLSSIDPHPLFSIKLTGRDLDAGMFRKSALLLADDVASVQQRFRYLQGGAIAEIRVEARGRSFAEALESKQAVATANLRGVKIFVPGPDLDLENVSGSVLISAGVLECKELFRNPG